MVITRNTKFLISFCLALVVCRVLSMYVLFVYDDAFITFRYARNVATGVGLVYNAGEHVLGTTTPAFAILLSPFYWLGLPMPASAQWLNVLLDIAVLVFTWQIILRNELLLTKIIFGVLFLLSPMIARVTVGGMEVNLFLFICLLSLWLFEEEQWYWAATVAAASYFIRPEGGMLVGLLVLLCLLRKEFVVALRMIGISAAILVVPLLFIKNYYGSFLSQSVQAKMHLEFSGHSSVMGVLHAFFFPDPLALALVPFAIAGLVRALRGSGLLRLFTWWLVIYSLFYCISRPHIVSSWYGETCFYGEALLATLGVSYFVEWLKLQRIQKWSPQFAMIGIVLSVGFWGMLYEQEGSSPIERDIHGAVERWCSSNPLQNKSILAIDIGAIGYYSNARIFDLYGLVSPDLLTVHNQVPAIALKHPDFVFVGATTDSMARTDLTNDYYEVAHFAPAYRLGGGIFLKHWSAGYYIFKRKT